MMKRKACFGIASLLLFAASTSSLAQTGAETYKAKCQMCHGADGHADTPAGKALKARALDSPDVMKESDADLLVIIKNGKNKMPAFNGKLTDAQMKDALDYVHTLQKK